MVKVSLAILLCLAFVGCQTTTGGGRGDAFCDVAPTLRPSKAVIAAMSDAERRQALAYLRYGQANCGWRR